MSLRTSPTRQYFMTAWNMHPEFVRTLSHMRGHHPRGHELYDSALRGKIDFPAIGIRDNTTDQIRYGAMKVIEQLKKGNEVFLDVNKLQEMGENVAGWLSEHRAEIEAKEGSCIFDKLYFIAEPPPPLPVLTRDFNYAKTIASMRQMQEELGRRKVVA